MIEKNNTRGETMERYALITGATSGIGKAYAELLGENGYNLIITGRRKEILEKNAINMREKYGVEVRIILADFKVKEDVARVVDEIRESRVEFLVNNVGYGNKKGFLEDEYDIQRDMIRVHIDALCRISHEGARRMKGYGRGYIVNVSSLASYAPTSFNHLYAGTKSFINTFSEALYIDLIDEGVRVQSLCPGFTRTDFHREMSLKETTVKDRGLMRWMSPEKVAEISYREVLKTGGICIPGVCNRILYLAGRMIPRKIYYRFIKNKGM